MITTISYHKVQPVMSVRTAVIAGGGPVGAVAAIMLAQQGWKVQVLCNARAELILLFKFLLARSAEMHMGNTAHQSPVLAR